MSGRLIERAPAKINLTLRVIGRRADRYHTLESLVAFAGLADELALDPGDILGLNVRGTFAQASGPQAENLVLKAVSALGLPTGQFTLEKNIPVAAGLGGGSSDAAAALRLIARATALPLSDTRFTGVAGKLGADVAVCLEPRGRIMRGVGEELSGPLALPTVPVLLVNPGVALPTKDVFGALAEADKTTKSLEEENIPRERSAFMTWLAGYGNDLTRAARRRAPVIGQVLEELAVLPNARVSRMSGSGATCFALFESEADCRAGEQKLRAAHKNWWLWSGALG